MHIPEHMIGGAISPATAIAGAAGVAAAAYLAARSKERPAAARFAAVTALIFAWQMLNFPVPGGTSGHLMGGVLAAALLGTPLAVLSISLIVTIQALLFSDGGIAVLGANIFNMALAGAGAGGFFLSKLRIDPEENRTKYAFSIGFISWLSLVMASAACSVELALSGRAAFSEVAGAMLGIHSLIGIGEALITVSLFFALKSAGEKTEKGRHKGTTMAAAVLAGVCLSPFASSLPDGLEWTASRYSLLPDAAPLLSSPLQGYAVPALGSGGLFTALAGMIGISLTFFLAWMVGRALKMQSRLRPS